LSRFDGRLGDRAAARQQAQNNARVDTENIRADQRDQDAADPQPFAQAEAAAAAAHVFYIAALTSVIEAHRVFAFTRRLRPV